MAVDADAAAKRDQVAQEAAVVRYVAGAERLEQIANAEEAAGHPLLAKQARNTVRHLRAGAQKEAAGRT